MSQTVSAHRLLATTPASRALVDVAITAAVLVGTISQLSHGGVISPSPEAAGLDPLGVGLAVGASAPLLAWRRFPLLGYAVTAAFSVLLAGLGYPLDLLLGPTVALYLLAAGRDRRVPWTGRTTAVVVAALMAYLAATWVAQAGFPGIELMHTGLTAAGAWFAGERTRLRREQLAEFAERALRAERDAERERLLAVAEERARIARDLHDSAGHAISVIAVRAGAARLRHPREPDRSLPALTEIEELARRTVAEIDQTVRTLRGATSPNGGTTPHGLASLDALIAHHATTGLKVTLDRTGTPRPLATVADQAAYRILQEALTNAARHGTGGARITLGYGDAALAITVSNPVTDYGTPRPGGGHGLIGMRERASLLGGSLEVTRADGAFRVYARIPYGDRT